MGAIGATRPPRCERPAVHTRRLLDVTQVDRLPSARPQGALHAAGVSTNGDGPSVNGGRIVRWKSLVFVLPVLVLLGAACNNEDEPDDSTPASTEAAGTLTSTATDPTGTATEAAPTTDDAFVFGMILVGPRDDHGWSQAHFEAGEYIAERLDGEMIVIDRVNPADSPNLTIPQVVEDMVSQGADMVFATSDDMKDGILEAAAQHPDVPMIWATGDNAWSEGMDYREDLANLGNIMGEMEYGKMIAGCAAALQSAPDASATSAR